MATTSSPSSAIPPEIVDTIIEAFAQSIRPAFPFILVPATLSAILIPLLLMLLALSTSRSRRQPIFMLNVLTITLGLILGALYIHAATSSISAPLKEVDPNEDFALSVMFFLLPLITEAILILRVVVVYMPTYSSHSKIAQILAPSIVIKIVRAVLTIIFLVRWKRDLSSEAYLGVLGSVKQFDGWLQKTTWILELVDNAYISGLFLWRLAVRGQLFGSQGAGRVTGRESRSGSFTNRLKTLFWIASTNLIFPLIFNVLQITIIFVGNDVLLAGTISLAGVYVGIISTAFATIWSSTYSFKDAHQSMHDKNPRPVQIELKTKPIVFFDPNSNDTQSGTNSHILDSIA